MAGDEISLRDLYLIIRRGLPLIAVAALLSGAAAVLLLSLQGPSYRAGATVAVNPTPLRLQSGTIALDQRNGISYETYERIASSRGVLESTRDQLGESSLTVGALRMAGALTRISGPTNADASAPLIIAHEVTHSDPQLAARVADAWAGASVAAVRNTMRTSLEPLVEATETQLENLENRLAALDDQWQAFQERDDTALIAAELAGIAQRLPLTQAYAEELARLLADARSAREALAASADDSAAAVAARNQELQALTGRIAGLEAQLGEAERQLGQMRDQAEALRIREARLIVERDRLRNQMTTFQTTYTELSAVAPALQYVLQLLPGNTRVLGTASIPTDPIGMSRLVIGVIAALTGGLLALLFVFLRAAVSPEPLPRKRASRAEHTP